MVILLLKIRYPSPKLLSALIIATLLYLPSPLFAQDTSYKKTWNDKKGKHEVTLAIQVMTNGESSQVALSGKGLLNNKQEWVINDFIKNCLVDADIILYPNSFEIVDIDRNNEKYLLFSYVKNCHGGVNSGEVKYFAYHNKTKYSLRGEETIIINKTKEGGEKKIIISSNLHSNLPLLNYMQKKWSAVSTTDYNKR